MECKIASVYENLCGTFIGNSRYSYIHERERLPYMWRIGVRAGSNNAPIVHYVYWNSHFYSIALFFQIVFFFSSSSFWIRLPNKSACAYGWMVVIANVDHQFNPID